MLSADGAENPGSGAGTEERTDTAAQDAASSPPAQDMPQASDGTDAAKARRRSSVRNSVALSQIIGVLMRSPHYRQYTLGDLEWLVIPPVLAEQFRLGEVRTKNGATLPVAVVLWAKVSPEVDERLTASDSPALRLGPKDWTSGEILWLTHAVGEPRFVQHLLKQISQTTFKGLDVKTRARGEDGKLEVQLLPT